MNDQTHNTNYNILLMEYAAGTLDRAQTMIISAHINLSPTAKEMVRSCESIGGALIEKHCEPVSMNSDSLDRILSHIDQKSTPKEKPTPSPSGIFPDDLNEIPECVQSNVSCKSNTQLKWKRVYHGIHAFTLPIECQRSKASIFRLDPGITTPSRAQRSVQITLIMDGGFEDETGQYQRGDLVINDLETPAHSPQACHTMGCTYMSVSSKSIRLIDPLTALMNPFRRF